MVAHPEAGVLRIEYHKKLDALSAELARMGCWVADALQDSTAALLEPDLAGAESVINQDAWIDEMAHIVEQRCFELVALEQPVAQDLRLVIGSLRISASFERMGDLAQHVAKLARLRYPQHVVPEPLSPIFSDMSRIGGIVTRRTLDVMDTRSLDGIPEIVAYESEIDRLHQQIFDAVQDPQWPYGADVAVDVTLLSRYYERFCDHAVSVTRRTVAIITGGAYLDVRLQPELDGA